MAELVVVQEVAAPVQRVWDVLTDWGVHDRWMLFTRAEGGRAEGETISAFTGIDRQPVARSSPRVVAVGVVVWLMVGSITRGG